MSNTETNHRNRSNIVYLGARRRLYEEGWRREFEDNSVSDLRNHLHNLRLRKRILVPKNEAGRLSPNLRHALFKCDSMIKHAEHELGLAIERDGYQRASVVDIHTREPYVEPIPLWVIDWKDDAEPAASGAGDKPGDDTDSASELREDMAGHPIELLQLHGMNFRKPTYPKTKNESDENDN